MLSAAQTTRTPVRRWRRSTAALIGVLAVATGAVASEVPDNKNIVRWARGTYEYRTLEDKTPRGSERFELMVHPDGSRTMLMWHDLAARNAQFTVVLRTDAAFRPVEAYLNYWVESGYKGSALLRVDRDELGVTSQGASGAHTQIITAPEQFSIGTHPVSADGWHLYQQSTNSQGQPVARIYIMEASADLTKPLLGSFVEMPFEVLADDATMTTPAGTFVTTHYRLAGGLSDIWLAGEDRLLVRMVNERRGLEYVLSEYTRGGGEQD